MLIHFLHKTARIVIVFRFLTSVYFILSAARVVSFKSIQVFKLNPLAVRLLRSADQQLPHPKNRFRRQFRPEVSLKEKKSLAIGLSISHRENSFAYSPHTSIVPNLHSMDLVLLR